MQFPSNYQEACNLLVPRGFVFREIFALCQWQERYRRTGQHWADQDVDIRRLEFVRWLATTRRLTEFPLSPEQSTPDSAPARRERASTLLDILHRSTPCPSDHKLSKSSDGE